METLDDLMIAEVEETGATEVAENEDKSPLDDFINYSVVDSFTELDDEVSSIERIEEIQDFEKMYQFVNQEITHDALNEYADKCLQYISPNFNEYKKIERRTAEIKSKPMVIHDAELDFI